MQPQHPVSTDIVLIGAGHAHVEVLRRVAMRPMPGVRLTLIAREPHAPYSGMLPGLIRGDYDFDAAHIDCAPLAAAARARLLIAEATAIDLDGPQRKRRGAAGCRVRFSVHRCRRAAGGAGGRDRGEADRPVPGAACRAGSAAARRRPHRRGRRRRRRHGTRARARAPVRPARAHLAGESRRRTGDARRRRGARRAIRARAGRCRRGDAERRHRRRAGERARFALSDGSFIEAAAALWATGVVAPEFLAASGLACDAAGCVRVDATLRSVSHPFVFAAGDCAAIEGNPRPKSGVWAVRAGAPLAANLRRAAAGRPLRRWRPQREALAILGTRRRPRGRLAQRVFACPAGSSGAGRTGSTGAGCAMYQRLRPMPMPRSRMRCARLRREARARGVAAGARGPGADGARRHPRGPRRRRRCGGDAAAAGHGGGAERRSFPRVHRRSVSCSARSPPRTRSPICTRWARAPGPRSPSPPCPTCAGAACRTISAAMMRGALEILTADGCALVGGHSAEGAEAALGFAVNGLVDPAQALAQVGAAAGRCADADEAARHRHRARRRHARAGEGALAAGGDRQHAPHQRRGAARILREHGVTACTDVTGFGLGGHLREMLTASDVSAAIDPAALKLLPGARELAAQGVESSLAPDNRAGARSADHPALPFLVDPQTSGGLLARACAPERGRCLPRRAVGGRHRCGDHRPRRTRRRRRYPLRTGRKPMRTHRIAAIPADGIGPEVIAAGLEVLDALQHATAASNSPSIITTGAPTITASTAR